MVLYKLMVVHWSIFTLFTQLVFCASAYSNSNANSIEHKSICDDESVEYIHETGSESSLVLNLYPDKSKPSCKHQFYAPDSHSFYVRLQRIPPPMSTSRKVSLQNGMSKKYGSKKSSNVTDSCLLSISHSLNGEVMPPWRLDPCELEASSSKEEPMRLLQGRLNIVWNHLGNRPGYRLMVTVIGNGAPCLEKDRHPCLEVDGIPLLCISKDLVCDGIRHCPSSVNGVNDEDIEMCASRSEKDFENPMQMVFRKYIQSTFKSFFNTDPTDVPSSADSTVPMDEKRTDVVETETKIPTKQHKSTLTGLSKYGPWGYLFLGMLLCGGALLVCGLWECCCRSHKPDAPDLPSQDNPSVFLESGLANTSHNTSTGAAQSLPPYEDLDPPPAYSVLFPNQKSSDNLPSLAQASSTSQQSADGPSDDPVQSSSGGATVAGTAHIQTQTGQ